MEHVEQVIGRSGGSVLGEPLAQRLGGERDGVEGLVGRPVDLGDEAVLAFPAAPAPAEDGGGEEAGEEDDDGRRQVHPTCEHDASVLCSWCSGLGSAAKRSALVTDTIVGAVTPARCQRWSGTNYGGRVTHPAVAALAQIAEWPELVDPITEVRETLTALRWHQALRRRIPESAAESRVRGAQASGELEGSRLPVDLVREYIAGVRGWPADPDPVEGVMRGIVAATAASEEIRGQVLTAPAQALARLHVAAVGHLVGSADAPGSVLQAEQVGRPRAAEEVCAELVDVGPPPAPGEVAQRLSLVSELVRGHAGVPAVVLAAVVHAEIATLRPFTRGNAIVARALERALVQATGLDPTGVAVTELGHFRQTMPAYVGALAAYATGSRDGVRIWLEHCCQAYVAAGQEGKAVADAVLAGRLPQ